MEHKVTLLVGKNGSIEVIDEDKETDHWAELSFLGIFLVLSTVMNLGIVGVGLLGRSRGTVEIPTLVLALCISNTLDAMVNHTLTLMFLTIWPDSSPSSIICRLSAVFYLSALLVQPLYILSHFLRNEVSQKWTAFQLHQRYFIVVPALVTGVLSSPVLIIPSVITAKHFISRHVCCLTGENPLYSAGLTLFGFILPWAAIFYCSVTRKCFYDTSHQLSGNDRELRYLTAATILVSILVLPAVISFSIASLTNLHSLSTYKDSDDDIVVITGTFDTVLTWMRFSFNSCYCFLILVFFKDLRQEWVRICLLIKERSVGSCYYNNIRESKNIQSNGGPILFVTSGGLMLLRVNTNDCTPLEKCDLVEREQNPPKTLSNNSLIGKPLSPLVPKVRKKWDKNAKRKIVRFAQSVKEIPPFVDI